jgi:hypothetical protein
MVTQPIGITEGIYFNLPNEEYHDDPALSHSGMTHVLVSWPDYWIRSALNPQRKKFNPTDAMIFGQRAGMLLLEPDTFYKSFNTAGRAPNAKAHFISSIEYERLMEGRNAVIEMDIGREHFIQGYPEVSIFFRIDGIMVRVRIDYLRTFGCIDYKRIKEVNNYEIGRAVKNQGLDIQDFLYLEGVKASRLMLQRMTDAELAAFAKRENVAEDWLRDFRDDTDLLFRFLFQRSTPPYIWEFRELENEVLSEGAHAVFAAIRRYKKGLEVHGIGRPPLGQSTVKTVSQYHVPRRDYDYGED